MRGECYVRLLVHPDAASAKKAIVPYIGDMMNPDISLVMGANRPYLVVPPKPATYNEEGELIEDDEFADFEKHDNVAFSFVRHNRYEAIEAIIQQESGILEARDEFGNNMLHVACQNDHRRIAKLLLKNGINVNDQNLAGNTPLHYCFQYNFLHLSDYLIAHAVLPKLLCKKPLVFLGGISFPIFVVHGPIGQLFYKKAVAVAVWGQNMASPQPVGIHWFFLVYWLTVLVSAQILQKARRVRNLFRPKHFAE
eukprot:g13666.t1